jgi:hypothetical protein
VAVVGRVLDYRSQAALAGASVHFSSDAQLGDAVATTRPDGTYQTTLPAPGSFTISVGNAYVGTGLVPRSSYRGDLFVDGGTCISRYGVLADARTQAPVVGAVVSLGEATATSGSEGWYRIDLGCPATGAIGFNTTFLTVTHPRYTTASAVVGRGISGVRRLDINLEPA